MEGRVITSEFAGALLEILAQRGIVMGPVAGEDGVIRLRPVTSWSQLSAGALPRIPLKKVVFPSGRDIWRWVDGGYSAVDGKDAIPAALVGIAPCDLYGLAYLDRVFAEDERYRQRRQGLVLVAAACQADDSCSCPPRTEFPPCDLFLGTDTVWALSDVGESLLSTLSPFIREAQPALSLETMGAPRGTPLPESIEDLFQNSARNPVWQREAQRCFSCGACSAVCPTCYCYDAVDTALPDGSVTRSLAWDNCFFREHGLVAGGYDFRAGRKARLMFRFEHKRLGFGALRGIDSCVGCGRCLRACPVGISVSAIGEELAKGEG